MNFYWSRTLFWFFKILFHNLVYTLASKASRHSEQGYFLILLWLCKLMLYWPMLLIFFRLLVFTVLHSFVGGMLMFVFLHGILFSLATRWCHLHLLLYDGLGWGTREPNFDALLGLYAVVFSPCWSAWDFVFCAIRWCLFFCSFCVVHVFFYRLDLTPVCDWVFERRIAMATTVLTSTTPLWRLRCSRLRFHCASCFFLSQVCNESFVRLDSSVKFI